MSVMPMLRAALLGLSLAVAPLAAVAATPAAGASGTSQQAQAAVVAKAQQYLNSIRTLKARFTQIAPNGAITHGTAWLERPGRMRFQYDPPTPLLLVAGHGFVLFEDFELGQTSSIPLGRTPLGILLADHIALTGDGLTVTGVRQGPQSTQITVVRTATPSEGTLALTFSTDPWALRQWTVTDAQGQRTTVVLSGVQTGITIDQSLFSPVAPMTGGGAPGGG